MQIQIKTNRRGRGNLRDAAHYVAPGQGYDGRWGRVAVMSIAEEEGDEENEVRGS